MPKTESDNLKIVPEYQIMKPDKSPKPSQTNKINKSAKDDSFFHFPLIKDNMDHLALKA